VKNEHFKPLYIEVMPLLQRFETYRVIHVPREDNARAAELANLAYDPH